MFLQTVGFTGGFGGLVGLTGGFTGFLHLARQLFWQMFRTTGLLQSLALANILQNLVGMLFLHGLNCGGFSVGGGGFVAPGFGFLVQYG